jgi:hypothetical protein
VFTDWSTHVLLPEIRVTAACAENPTRLRANMFRPPFLRSANRRVFIIVFDTYSFNDRVVRFWNYFLTIVDQRTHAHARQCRDPVRNHRSGSSVTPSSYNLRARSYIRIFISLSFLHVHKRVCMLPGCCGNEIDGFGRSGNGLPAWDGGTLTRRQRISVCVYSCVFFSRVV